jgi:3-oxoacyl-[acyl-carrier protein] reductase
MGMLDGKVAAVTGAGNGLGLAYAQALGAAGAGVVCSDIDGEAARRVADEITASGGAAVGRNDDVGRWASGDELVAAAVEAFGKLDVLVNNAGVLRDRMMWNLTEADLDSVYRVHVKGTFACGIALARHLRQRGAGGSIINVTSAAHQGHAGQSNYSAMKGAIASLTYTWALELARFGIRVNAISPMAWTAMTQTVTGDEDAQRRMAERLGSPDLVAPMVVYLASDDASWISGQIIGACNERISLLLHPREVRQAYCLGGWTPETLAARFRSSTGAVLEPCGSTSAQYAWYDGIQPEAPAAASR